MLEQAGGLRRSDVGHDAVAAGRLAGDRDIGGVAAECRCIALDPAQRGLLVHHAIVGEVVTLAIEGGMREKAEQSEPVVEGDDQRAALDRKLGGIVIAPLADLQRAAMEPDEYRQLARHAPLGGAAIDVQVEAIFAATGTRKDAKIGVLRAAAGERGRLHRRGPRCYGLRRLPAQGAYRRRRVRDTEPGVDAAQRRADGLAA